MTRTAVLGGETSRRGLLGGGMTTTRKVWLGTAVAVGMVLTILFQLVGIVAAIVMVGAAYVLTAGQEGRSPLDRLVGKRRLKAAAKRGTDTFTPFDQARWDELAATKGSAARRDAAALRQMPDGADGMGWLDMSPQSPGIAWHSPVGEAPYLSVCFSVTGQMRGIESEASLDGAAEAWGKFQASLGSLSSLATGVQTLTRVLPPDSARHENWVKQNLDRTAPVDLLRSYDHLLKHMSAGSMIQRHYVVVTWPRNGQFAAAAAQYGPGRDGWRALMAHEITSITRRLVAAREGQVRVLTARQTAGVIRHMQNPDWPIDQASDIDPTRFGLAALPAGGAHLVVSPGPDGQERTWYHRTALISAGAMATSARSPLWLLPVLTGMRRPIVRTISFTRVVIPSGQAKRAARKDVVADRSDRESRRKAGRLADDETDMRLGAAERRKNDLRAGSGHAGVEWIGNITVSARTEAGLAQAVRLVAEACDSGLGVEHLEWLDSFQPAASGLTWPIGRGLRPTKSTFADRVERRVAG